MSQPGDSAFEPRPRLGVSACLVGDPVRFDGGHRRDDFLNNTLARFVSWMQVCPEAEAGLGVPREPMRLVTLGAGARVITSRTQRDCTDVIEQVANRRMSEDVIGELDGYVWKKDSPSCGLWRVKTYGADGTVARNGRGVFADAVSRVDPLLPMEEEGRLCDPAIREHFLERTFARQRLRTRLDHAVTVEVLMHFHAAHKFQLLSHSPTLLKELGQQVARATTRSLPSVLAHYKATFQKCLQAPTGRGRHVNVLEHVGGFLREHLNSTARRDWRLAVAEYAGGLVPLIVPITLLAHYAKVHDITYLLQQSYLDPYPKELRLRNHD